MVYGKCFVTVLAVVGVALAAPKSEEMSNVSISTRTRRRFIDDNLRAPIPSLPTTAIPFARCRRSLLPLGTGPNNAVAPAETSNVRNTFRPAVPRNRELPMFVRDSYGPPDVTRVSAKRRRLVVVVVRVRNTKMTNGHRSISLLVRWFYASRTPPITTYTADTNVLVFEQQIVRVPVRAWNDFRTIET